MILQLITSPAHWVAALQRDQLVTELDVIAFALVEEGVAPTRFVIPIVIDPATNLPADLRAVATARGATITELRQRPS